MSRWLVAALLVAGALLVASPRRGAGTLTEYPPGAKGARLALIVTGDDGATSTIRSLARHLATDGMPSVVLTPADTLATPGAASAAVERVVREHLARWQRERLVVIGLARGAGMAPFVANRLAGDLRSRLDAVVMREPHSRVNFRRRWHAPWRQGTLPTDLPLLPELERMRGTPLLCLYRDGERDAFCPSLDATLARHEVDPAPGDGERAGALLARRVIEFAR
ncbi:MAG TPA: AcvB/VirJ family lysyl-phosphatidylglycerol hydrolase [Gemmatimonadaceae bacterium]|nr:AcvB/VirJ family lysyl-phosphatidylglycerol hydrolase [Gemmatimonadaceae bacterium]